MGWAIILFMAAWSYTVIKRLPSDLAKMQKAWYKYRGRHDPLYAEFEKNASRREKNKRDSLADFLSEIGLNLFIFWPGAIISTVCLAYFSFILIFHMIIPNIIRLINEIG